MLLQTLTPLAQLAVLAILMVTPICSPLLLILPSIPIQPWFLALEFSTSPPFRDPLENPVLVSGIIIYDLTGHSVGARSHF